MIYDPSTGTLWASDGTFLKYIYCPKSVRWDDLGVTHQQHPESHAAAIERSRDCSHCRSTVTSLDALSDGQVAALLRKEPSACIYLRTDWANVTVLKAASPTWQRAPKWSTSDGSETGVEASLSKAMRDLITETTPRIHTGRTLEQINAAAMQGFKVLLRPALSQRPSQTCEHDVEVWQNAGTGEVFECIDLRERPNGYRGGAGADNWHLVLTLRHVFPYQWPSPFAAYLVPQSLPPGTLVLLTDPIEDIVGHSHWGTYRARLVPATWTGSEIQVHAEEVKVPIVVG